MFILNTNSAKPENQTHDWKHGLVARKHKVGDFQGFFWSFPIFAVMVIFAYSGYVNEAPKGDMVGYGMTVFMSGLVALYNFSAGMNKPKLLVELVARDRSVQWQYDVLIPYLENKYGVTFDKRTDLIERMSAWVRKGDEQFKVIVENVEIVPSYQEPGEPYSYGYVFDDYLTPTLQRVHHPKVASYEALQTVA